MNIYCKMAGYKIVKGKRVRQHARPLRRSAPLLSRVRKLEKKTSAIESKFIDFTAASAVIATGAVNLLPLQNIQQGDQASQRNGDSVTLTSVQARIMFTAFTAADQNNIRIIIVHDKQSNGALMTSAEMFLDGTNGDINVSPYNLDNKHRFKFLCDEYVDINDNGQSSFVWKKYIKLNMKIRYDATTGNVTDLTSSNLALFIIGFDAAALGDSQSIVRVRYLDG